MKPGLFVPLLLLLLAPSGPPGFCRAASGHRLPGEPRPGGTFELGPAPRHRPGVPSPLWWGMSRPPSWDIPPGHPAVPAAAEPAPERQGWTPPGGWGGVSPIPPPPPAAPEAPGGPAGSGSGGSPLPGQGRSRPCHPRRGGPCPGSGGKVSARSL